MNINEKLLLDREHYKYHYDCPHKSIKKFLTDKLGFLDRQKLAITVIEKIMTAHKKQLLLRHVVELARIENGIRELEPRVRDHVVHALLSYLLGIYINENLISKILGHKVDPFQWKLAGLFHDIGYPAQITKDILKSYSDRVNDIRAEIGVDSQEIFFKLVPIGLEKLQNNVNSFDLFQKIIDKWGLEINAKDVYDTYINSGKICHGMISALSVLYIIDLSYQKNNPDREILQYSDWSQEYFDNNVVPACTAIFIHHLPSQYFETSKISLEKSPIAYLLRLSDCLQDWERPSYNYKCGFPANLYDIEVENKKLIFSLPNKRKKIVNEIVSFVSSENIEFRVLY